VEINPENQLEGHQKGENRYHLHEVSTARGCCNYALTLLNIKDNVMHLNILFVAT